jgi:membrane protein required for colicin V production
MNNWIDLTLGLMMILSIVAGLSAGFAKTAVGFAASILGLIFGLHYYHVVGHTLHLSNTTVANVVGFLIVYCGIVILGSVIAGLLAKFLRSLDLVWLDRLLGAGFGAARGLLFCTITIWGIMAFFPVQPKLVFVAIAPGAVRDGCRPPGGRLLARRSQAYLPPKLSGVEQGLAGENQGPDFEPPNRTDLRIPDV